MGLLQGLLRARKLLLVIFVPLLLLPLPMLHPSSVSTACPRLSPPVPAGPGLGCQGGDGEGWGAMRLSTGFSPGLKACTCLSGVGSDAFFPQTATSVPLPRSQGPSRVAPCQGGVWKGGWTD